MGRSVTCNELISPAQRAQILELFTGTRRTYLQISVITKVPIAKIKSMTAGIERPRKTGPISNNDFNALMVGWKRSDGW
ncbi:MAG: hypothetical protein IIC63_06780 [Proteobacteria bacterium]|nr:hypothetical protein [Pseudomonadota bacterium]